MSDLSKLSDDELRALYARQAQAQRAVSQMTDDELRAAAYVQPQPPPGVTVNYGENDRRLQLGGGKEQRTSEIDARARAFRETTPAAIYGDRASAYVRGVPLAGPFTSRAVSAGRALVGDGTYASNLENEQALERTYDQDNPIESTALKVGGAITGTVAGARALPAFAGYGLGTGATSFVNGLIRGGVAGGTQGIAQGVGDTADLTNMTPEDIQRVGKSGLFGLAIGTAVPAAFGAAGKAVDWIKNRGIDAADTLSRPARRYVDSLLRDPAQVAAQKSAVNKLGPDAMLADVSPEWLGVAQGASALPGSRSPVVDALLNRDAGKNARLSGAVAQNIGGDVIPSEVKTAIKTAKEKLSPLYEEVFSKAKAVDTKSVADKLDTLAIDKRGAAQVAAKEVRNMLNIAGEDVLDPNPRTLHQVRMAIDGMLEDVRDTNVIDVLKQARKSIDEELAAKVPGIKPIDAQYAEISRQTDAFKKGQAIFDGGRDVVLRPSEVEKLKTTLVQPAGTAAGPPTATGLERLSEGARSEIWRLLGTNSNDVAKLNTLLKGEGDWNRDKLRLLFGQNKADRLLQVLDAERAFENTKRLVVDNSQTAPRMGFAEKLKEMAKGTDVPTDRTATGLVLAGVQKAARKISQKHGDDAAEQFAKELARLSTATGADRDLIIDALLKRGVRRSVLNKYYDAGGRAVSPVSQALMSANDSR